MDRLVWVLVHFGCLFVIVINDIINDVYAY